MYLGKCNQHSKVANICRTKTEQTSDDNTTCEILWHSTSLAPIFLLAGWKRDSWSVVSSSEKGHCRKPYGSTLDELFKTFITLYPLHSSEDIIIRLQTQAFTC